MIVFLPLLAAAWGCGPGRPPATLGPCPDDSTITWSDVERIFANDCTNCHHSDLLTEEERSGAPELVNFDTPEAAISQDFLAWNMIYSDQMPFLGEPLEREDKWLIWEWFSCGGPE